MANRGSNTRPATLNEARVFLARAAEFVQAARDAAGRENWDATAGNAVHAAIAAADAISSALLGERWVGDHSGAGRHVERVGDAGQACARQLRTVLPLKNRAEYDPVPVRPAEGQRALMAAERALNLAQDALDGLGD